MKKTLAAAITSALVIGAASTTFAAANPFSDVPADHWSYDAVAELAQAGIVDGYGDGSFRGDRAITRYEMAQIVAKAMAKDVNGDAKATLDKLAAEYAEELNNLGVRVDALEKKVDNTKFNGELRFRYQNTEETGKDDSKAYPAMFRLETTSQVNDSWVVKTRSEAEYQMDGDSNTEFDVKRAYAQGKLFGATAKLGKAGYAAANGLVYDDPITGAQFDWSFGNATVGIAAGKLADDCVTSQLATDDVSIASLQVGYNFTDKLGFNAGYYELRGNEAFAGDKNKIWSVGADYSFNDNLNLAATYANSDLDDNDAFNSDDDAFAVTLQYKGANKADKGSFGVDLGYYDLSNKVSFDPTWDATSAGVKGWRIGTNYTVAENILWSAWYFDGDKKDNSSTDWKRFRTQVEFFF
jgi:hypothetical protein